MNVKFYKRAKKLSLYQSLILLTLPFGFLFTSSNAVAASASKMIIQNNDVTSNTQWSITKVNHKPSHNKPTKPEEEKSRLKIALPAPGLDIDTVFCFDNDCMALSNAICANLFKADKEGNIVPEVAKKYPTKLNGGVSLDGKTYTIEVRNDFKFSNGERVRPLDVKRSIERAARIDFIFGGEPGPHVENLEGVYDLVDNMGNPLPDGEISGIVVDGNKLHIGLTEANGDLPAKLASFFAPTFCIFPDGVPGDDFTGDIFPNSGPYKVNEAAYEQGQLLLERNPYYPHNKPFAQPANFDEIEYVFGLDPQDAIQGVVDNIYDFAGHHYGGLDALRTSAPNRYYEFNEGGINSLFMQTENWPMCNVNFRKALNYGIDRNHLINIANGGSDGTMRATNQYIMPDIVGFSRYLQQNPVYDYDGDIPSANAKLQAFRDDMINYVDPSCTGEGVEGWDPNLPNYDPQHAVIPFEFISPDFGPGGSYIGLVGATIEAQLEQDFPGVIDAIQVLAPEIPRPETGLPQVPDPFLSYIVELSFGDFQMTRLGWVLDWADPTNYVNPQLSGEGFIGLTPEYIENFARFADFDAQMLQAKQTTHPLLRDYRYRKLNQRLVTEGVPWVPFAYYINGVITSERIGCVNTSRWFANFGAMCVKND